MVPVEETLDIMKTNELSGLLGDLSFSYMEVYSSRQSLMDLQSSIESLRSLVEGLEAEVKTACSILKI